MKALFILRKLKKRCLDFDYDRLVEEAIAELEALQSPKTCDGCKYLVQFGNRKGSVICNHSFACARRITHEDYYEPKETR